MTEPVKKISDTGVETASDFYKKVEACRDVAKDSTPPVKVQDPVDQRRSPGAAFGSKILATRVA